MPLYEYQCSDCGHRLEALQKMSDDPLVYCPECNAPSLKKLISAAAFHLKGTGWYETDFKNSGNKPDDKAGNSSTGDAGKSGSGDGGSGDSSSSTKSESKSGASSEKSGTSTKGSAASSSTSAAA